MRRWLALLLVGVGTATPALALDPHRAVTQYIEDTWGAKDGLPAGSVISIAQTADGYVWVGGGNGLARFDGVRFTVFDRTRLSASGQWAFVGALATSGDGGLWISGPEGQLTKMSGGRFESVDMPAGMPVAAIMQLLEDRHGTLWAAYRTGELRRLRAGAWDAPPEGEGLRATSFAETRDGQVWIATDAGLLAAGDRIRFVTHDSTAAVAADPTEGAWALTTAGALQRVSGGHVTTVIARGVPVTREVRMTADRDGNVWIGTVGKGLVRVQGDRLDALGTANGFVDDVAQALLEDAEGNLWVGNHSSGLARLRDGKVVVYGKRQGLSHDSVKTVYADRDGIVWAGTYGGGLDRLDPSTGEVRTYGAADGIPGEAIRSVLADRAGRLLVGTMNAVVERHGERFRPVLWLPAEVGTVNTMLNDGDGVWVSTFTGGVLRVDRGPTKKTLPSLPSRQVGPMLLARDGTLWIGTYGAGLLAIRDGRIVASHGGGGTAMDSILGLHEDGAGALWIGTASGSLGRLKGGRLALLGKAEGLAAPLVFEMVEDGRGGAWLTTSDGILRVDKASLDAAAEGRLARLDVERIGLADGLRTPQCAGGSQPAVSLAPDGRVWVATQNGLVVVDPARARAALPDPQVFVEEVTVDGGTVRDGSSGPPLVLDPGPQSIEVRYTATRVPAPSRIVFRHRLEGYDTEWREAGARRTAYYTHVPPGRYTFRVEACDLAGHCAGPGAALAIRVRPFFHQTPWFYALCALVLGIAANGAHRLRLRHLQARERELVALVDERTGQLREEKARAEEANRAKSRFLASMSHELRTPLNAILGFAQLLRRDPTIRGEQREQVEIIDRSGAHLLGMINDVLSLSEIEAGRATLNESAFGPAAVVREVVSMLRLRAQAKGVALRAHLDPSLPAAVRGDEGKLRQVLINLAGNAIKFTERGSVDVRAAWSDGVGTFEVEDTGPGLTADEIGQLFTAFSQTESGRRAREGTGLGLVISRNHARRMGGDVTVSSTPGVGTTFRVTVRLPAERPEVAREPRRVIGLDMDRPVRILLADDVAEGRAMITQLLQRVGFVVHAVANGAEAVAAWEELRPDAVLMDGSMPVMDGRSATRRIREIERQRGAGRTVVIAFSASVLDDERAEFLAAGHDDFLPKPFRDDVLLEKLGTLLGLRYRWADGPAGDDPVPHVPEPAEPLDAHAVERCLALAGRLSEQLATNNFAAVSTFAELEAALGDRLVSPRKEMASALDALDYGRAADALAMLRERLPALRHGARPG